MINLSKYYLSLIVVVYSLAFTACEFRTNPKEIEIMKDQYFEVLENSEDNTLVGTIKTNLTNMNEASFEIVSGDPNNIFKIEDKTGKIRIDNSQFLDFELSANHELVVELALKSRSEAVRDTIIVNVINQEPTEQGLVSYFKLDGISDSQDGFYTYNVDYEDDKHFNYRRSMKFSGNGYASLNSPYDFENRTISLWFLLDDSYGQHKSIIYVSDNPDLNYGISALSTKDLGHELHLYYNLNATIDTAYIEKQTWYNAVLISKGLEHSYYLNGKLIGSGTTDDYYTSMNGLKSAVLGSARSINKDFFFGLMNDVRIYNRALSPKEVFDLYREE